MSYIKKLSHILAALLLAAASAAIVWYYVKINTPGVMVVVAADRLNMGTVIGAQHVVEKKYPASVAPPDAETSTLSVLGKTIISGTVFEGDVIRKGHVRADQGSLTAVLDSVAPGREAIDLPLETAGGLRGIAVGDRVNVYTEIAVQYNKEAVTVVDCAAREAVIIKIPPVNSSGKDGPAAAVSTPAKGSFVIAVNPDEVKKVAEGIVRGKKFSISLLPSKGGQ